MQDGFAVARAWTCPNCGEAAAGRYCANCGEARVAGGASAARTFATRLRRSLNALASPPGRLTRDWIDGRRAGYLAPVPLFLYTNVAFFLIQWASGLSVLSWPFNIHLSNDFGSVARSLAVAVAGHNAIREPRFIAVFDALEVVHAKALVIVMLPLFALPVTLIALRGQRTFARAFTFSAHFFTYALIAMCALFPLASLSLRGLVAAGVRPTPDQIDTVITTLQALLLGGYLAVALKTLTALALLPRLMLAALLLGALWWMLMLYHLVVFAVTLMAM